MGNYFKLIELAQDILKESDRLSGHELTGYEMKIEMLAVTLAKEVLKEFKDNDCTI